jgi:hypothetical protein
MLGCGFIVANWVSPHFPVPPRAVAHLVTHQVGYGCQYIDSDVSWRLPLGLQVRFFSTLVYHR